MSRKTYYNSGAHMLRAYARQYKDREDNTARIAENVDNIVPRNYAAIALALHRLHGFSQDQILEVLEETQEYHNMALFEGFDILAACSEETGLDMVGEVHAKKHRIAGDLRI